MSFLHNAGDVSGEVAEEASGERVPLSHLSWARRQMEEGIFILLAASEKHKVCWGLY